MKCRMWRYVLSMEDNGVILVLSILSMEDNGVILGRVQVLGNNIMGHISFTTDTTCECSIQKDTRTFDPQVCCSTCSPAAFLVLP